MDGNQIPTSWSRCSGSEDTPPFDFAVLVLVGTHPEQALVLQFGACVLDGLGGEPGLARDSRVERV